jgi:hypothetical protein
MRKLCGLIVLVTSLAGASSASAAVEVGNDCLGTTPTGGTAVQIQRASASALPLTVPSAGVVTSWTVRSGFPVALTQKFKVFRPAGKPNQFTTIGESGPETVVQKTNVFATRIPVQAGDRFGVFGGPPLPTGAILLCETGNAEDKFGVNPPDTAVGATTEFPEGSNFLVAVSATVEPDTDGDGFGDETQDKCPRSAKLQTECPLISLSSFGIPSKNSALLLLASSSSATVNVDATVKVPGKTRKGKKGKGKGKTLKLSGGAQTVAPGQLARFVISYSVPLKAALTALPRGKTLTLNVTASATDAAGAPSSIATALKLKGQAKAKR